MSEEAVVVVGKEEIHIDRILKVDENDLANEFAFQAAQYGRFAVMTAEAESRYMVAKKTTERVYALVDCDVRDEAAESGKKLTEAAVRSLILLDEEYEMTQNDELIALADYKSLRAIADALKMRADMLISLGAHNRAEMGMTGMSISDKSDELIAAYKKSAK